MPDRITQPISGTAKMILFRVEIIRRNKLKLTQITKRSISPSHVGFLPEMLPGYLRCGALIVLSRFKTAYLKRIALEKSTCRQINTITDRVVATVRVSTKDWIATICAGQEQSIRSLPTMV